MSMLEPSLVRCPGFKSFVSFDEDYCDRTVIAVEREDGATRRFEFNSQRTEPYELSALFAKIAAWLREPIDAATRLAAWSWWHALADLHGDAS